MKKVLKIMSVLLAVAVVAVSFAACSDSTDDASNTNGGADTQAVKVIDINLSDEEYAFGVDKNQPELMEEANALIAEIKADGTLDEICNRYFGGGTPVGVTSAALDTSKDQLVVATNAEFEPFEYKSGDTFYGIDMEIAQLLADRLGKELVIQDMNFDAVVLSVQQQQCDIAMAGLTVSEERAQQVDFTESYYEASQKLIVRGDDTTFDACTDKASVDAILNGLDSSVKIGGQNGTTGQSYVQGSEDLGFAGLQAQFVGYQSGSLAVNDLINGNVDYVIIDAAPAEAIVSSINAVN
ncbi:MAG TPA: transporter substrate-binding domain-containing protein [Candidatus Eubacterium faecipullorum]|uniref:Transporter substrate-binding domain-containing protein n=1 Tax=Candidatus Eubacterium faecipullorum TaxID=2838571 RepID=A0A9D1UGP2_9FIRM|nr:transporter substrate-binding domain-containing protein [Candidatus Eubacterium faecipullorum]